MEVNGKPYGVGCEDGQESHVRALAELLDIKVRGVAPTAGPLGDTRLMLLGGLMLADEVAEAGKALALAHTRITALESELEAVEVRAIAALDSAAQKLEAMAAR